ncbi:MAG: hypothetical protein J2O49_07060, partial [Sciscionella sp.]|nr:hypothetical protein [Sciscionella sp.]
AVLIAIVALHASRLPRRVRAIAWRTRPALTALHRLHSGHVGDYAAWLVLGCAVLAGLLAAG